MLALAAPAAAQNTTRPLSVTLDCRPCVTANLQKAIPFVSFVTPPTEADVTVSASDAAANDNEDSDADRVWTLTATGRAQFAGRDRTLTFVVADDVTAAQLEADLTKFLKLLLVEYAADTHLGPRLDVTFRPPPANTTGATPAAAERDPWNYWVFRAGASLYASGEEAATDSYTGLNFSANRTTEHWKLRFSAGRNVSKSSFDIDSSTTIRSRLSDWNINVLSVKSLGRHWSAALISSMVGSTYSNSKRVMRIEPGIEFDVFPYSESSKRSLTLTYTVGPSRYDYEQETIFGKMHETVMQHTVRGSLGLRQPWGQAGSTVTFVQQLNALERTRLTFNGNLNFRVLKSLNISPSGSYSRIRDQFTLAKGSASDEEVLLRQRQLATGYRYSFSIGFTYSFGALSNATVNPRFGGN